MKLSSRLLSIADMIEDDSEIFDIGCDHAYLDIFLTLNRHNIKCTAVDINKKIIEGAKENISRFNLNNQIMIIQSNGLDKLIINKNSTIVIAGLGAVTIISILKKNCNKLSDSLIIQSNNNHEQLRNEIIKLGFYIDKEKLVSDKEKDYITIKFKRGYIKYNKFDYILGPYLKNNKLYIKKIINKYKKIDNDLPIKYFIKKIKIKCLIYILKRRFQ